MDKNYKKILTQINTYEDVLLNQKLSTQMFSEFLLRILKLRKEYELNSDGKYVEASQFLNYLKELLIETEKRMSNATFDSVLKILTNVHKEFESKDFQYTFINRENQYLEEIAESMSKRQHSMTTRRLNAIAKIKADLKKQQELVK